MANDPYWGKVVSLIHADDAVDTNTALVPLAVTCNNADVAEIGSFVARQPLVTHYQNTAGVVGLYAFAASSSYHAHFNATETNLADNTNFTVEAWVYCSDKPTVDGQYRTFFTSRNSSGGYSNDYTFNLTRFSNTDRVYCTIRGTQFNFLHNFSLNQWVHIALVAQGTTGMIFVGGVLVQTQAIPATPNNTTTNGVILGYSNNTNSGFNGYLRDFRFTKSAKYTSGFTPINPLPYPHPFRDVKTYRTISAIGSATQPYTADSKFGGGCMRFDGASHVTGAASGDWNFGTGDFTIECFVKRETGGSTYKVIFGIWTNTFDRGWALALSDTNVLQFWARDNGSTEIGLSSGQVPALNTWVHVAVSRQGANLYLFIDGTLAATRSDVGAQIFGNSATALYFGRRSSSAADYFAGMVDEVRVTKGAARYTGNFTAPTQAHPEGITVVSGTVRDHTGALCSRLVRVHDRVSGRVVGEAMSDPTTGAFSIGAAEPLVYAVVLDNTGSYNSLILDRLEPQL